MIETQRLLLRLPRLDDFEPAVAMRQDPVVQAFISGGKPASREDVWIRLLRNIGHWAALGYGLFAVVERDGGRYLGEAGLADFRRELGERFDPFREAAWALAGWAHGRGFATEAAEAAHRWFFDERGPQRTVCIIDPGNAASVRVAEKLGYRAFGQSFYKDHDVTLFERLPG